MTSSLVVCSTKLALRALSVGQFRAQVDASFSRPQAGTVAIPEWAFSGGGVFHHTVQFPESD